MKNIHFFGCSFTAGDELSDDIYFPWKSECKTLEEYYEKRSNSEFDHSKYQEDNKNKSYPSMLGGINHASNGASLKENILKIVQLINSDTLIDAIYLQIPPYLRELYITEDNSIESLMFNSIDTDTTSSYIKTKILSHSDINFAVNDVLDLISFDNFIRNKNINFGIISFGPELRGRQLVLYNTPFSFLNTELNKLDIIDFKNYVFTQKSKIRYLGQHFTLEAHQHFAQVIKQHLYDKFSIT